MKTKAFAAIVLALSLLITLFVPSVASQTPPIKIGLIAPLGYTAGQDMMKGAWLALREIGNILGRRIQLIPVDEFQGQQWGTYETGTLAMELLMAYGCDFVIGGCVTESIMGAREVAMDNHTIFLVTGGYGASTNDIIDETNTAAYPNTVRANYARYKYMFRITPMNSTTLVAGVTGVYYAGRYGFVQYAVNQLKQIYGSPVRYAAIIENLAWASKIIPILGNYSNYATLYMGPDVKLAGWQGYYGSGQCYLVSPLVTNLDTVLLAIKNGPDGVYNTGDEARIIITWLSADNAGSAFINSWKKLDVRAIPVGINEYASDPGAWALTGGAVEYETVLAPTGTRTPITSLSIPFWDTYFAMWNCEPTYTAYGAYTGLHLLAEAVTRAGNITDQDKIVVELEKTDQLTPLGQFKFTGPHPMTPAAYNSTWTNGTHGALDLNPDMKGTLHDVYSVSFGSTWTDGYVRPLMCQWQKIPRGYGALEVVFPTDRPYSIKWRLPGKMFPLETDIVINGVVDGQDMAVVCAAWLKKAGEPGFVVDADFNSDGIIDIADANRVAADWGKTYPIPFPDP